MVVGDKVKVISVKFGHGFKLGQIVTIQGFDPEDNGYSCVDENNISWWLYENEFELLNQEQ